MNKEQLERIVLALQTIYAPNTSSSERRAAQDFCEQVKKDPVAPLYGHFLAHKGNSQPDTVRFFGLQLLEDCIRYQWTMYSQEQQVQIKQALVDLLESGMDVATTSKFLIDKAAHVFAEIVEREWPQNWSDLDAWLMKMFQSTDDLQKSLVLSIIQYIAQDTFVYVTPITSQRKDDLRNAMIAIFCPAPVDYAQANSLNVPAEVYQACGISSGNEGWFMRIMKLLASSLQVSQSGGGELMSVLCLETINAYIEWVPIDVIRDTELVKNLWSLSINPSFKIRAASLDCILSICSRKYSDITLNYELVLKYVLSNDGMVLLQQAWQLCRGDASQVDDFDQYIQEDYQLQLRFAELWNIVGVHMICHKRVDKVPEYLQPYLSFLLLLTSHQSMEVSQIALQVWTSMLRIQVLSESSLFQAVQNQLISLLISKMNKYQFVPKDPDDEEDQSDAASGTAADGQSQRCMSNFYNYIEYGDSTVAFYNGFGAYKSLMCPLLAQFTANCPLIVMQQSFQLLTSIVQHNLQGAVKPQQINSNKASSTDSKFYMQWECLAVVLQTIIGGFKNAGDNAEVKQALIAFTEQSLDALFKFEYKSDDTMILGKQLDCMVAFAPLLLNDHPPSLALSVLQKVFGFVVYRRSDNQEAGADVDMLSEDTLSLRRKAGVCVLKLGIELSDIFVGIYDQIKAEVDRLYGCNVLHHGEKAYLVEFLVAIVFNSKNLDAQRKQQLYQIIYEQSLSDIQSYQAFLSAISSRDSFYKAIGIDALKLLACNAAGSVEQLIACRQFQSKLTFSISVYKSCLARSVKMGRSVGAEERLAVLQQSPWVCNLRAMFPVYITVMRYVQYLWHQSMFADASDQSLKQILSITEMEKQMILGIADGGDDFDHTGGQQSQEKAQRKPIVQLKTLPEWVGFMQNWLRNLREQLYGLIGQCMYLVPGDYFYGIPSISQTIMENMFEVAQELPIYHWKQILLVIMKPLILNCPPEHYQDFLHPILPSVTKFIAEKLNREWGAVSASVLVDTDTEDGGDLRQQRQQSVTVSGQTVNDEVVNLKLLRDLSRAYFDVWNCVFVQNRLLDVKGGKQSVLVDVPQHTHNLVKDSLQRRLSEEFGVYKSLAGFILSDQAVFEPLLYGLVYSFNWKDCRCITLSCRILSKLVPILAEQSQQQQQQQQQQQSSALQQFLCTDVLYGTLKCLSEEYFKEVHDTVIALILDIIKNINKTAPLVIKASLQQAVSSLQTDAAWQTFAQKLNASNAPNAQRKVLREALGISSGQFFKTQLDTTHLPKKFATRTRTKILNDEEVNGLFG
ncbi:hypothetical protein MP228_011920 [Amoeboaphelidium protococcarum]|nr:hypothetical protein MP228_011920 [Amoeboaphelidium protococcarum]